MIVRFADPEPNGLAWMLGRLIEANLERHPGRRSLLKPAVIDLEAPDAEVAASVLLAPGGVTVANHLGANGRPHVRVRAGSDALLLLASVPLRLGFPDPLTPAGRRVFGKLLRGEIVVSGLVRHPGKLRRLSRLLSVV